MCVNVCVCVCVCVSAYTQVSITIEIPEVSRATLREKNASRNSKNASQISEHASQGSAMSCQVRGAAKKKIFFGSCYVYEVYASPNGGKRRGNVLVNTK